MATVHLPPELLAMMARGVSVIDHAAWQRLDSWEREAGAARGRVRHKIATLEEALDVLRR